MDSENKTALSHQDNGVSCRNALIIKIALFLNYLSKENHKKLMFDLQQEKNTSRIDIIQFMLEKNFITRSNMITLKKTCLNFAKAQEDIRFGSLCISFEFLTPSNLNLALEEQQKLDQKGRSVMLGDLLVEAGMISDRQRNLVLQKQKLEKSSQKNTPTIEIAGDTDKTGSSMEDPVFDKSKMREIREKEIIILIQHDGLKAIVIKTDHFDNSIALSDFKVLVEKYGIIYGIVDDESLEAFIQDEKYRQTYFMLAEGRQPIEGADARIIYMFERDYLKPGELAADGTIDFKERGRIPFVSKGDILAEKIPPKQGMDGVNIYGDAIPWPGAMDLPFIPGKGVCLSPDGSKLISETDGCPKLNNSNGEISVNDSYFIDGDVDYTTGHVKFNKNVFITGSIKNGFRVEAIDVVVNAVDGGIIKAQGDVFIQNGATESIIEAKGTIKAGFLLRSKADCMGNMTVVKEIVHSDVVVEGALEISRGRTFSSAITAKGGAKIYTVGSEKSSPATITIGTSIYFEQQLQQIDAMIEERQTLLETGTSEKNRIESELDIIFEKLKNYDHSRQRTMAIMAEMKENEIDRKDGKNISLFQKGLREADIKISDLNHEKVLLEVHLRKIAHDIEVYSEDVKNSVKEKFTLKRLNQANSPRAILDVEGKILAGTRVCGRYSNIILKENQSRSRIMEINSHNDDGKKEEWEMVIVNL
ncbi:MAG: flagellar assembly protein A [Desulfobacula sp.]|jgi:hypothetical protein